MQSRNKTDFYSKNNYSLQHKVIRSLGMLCAALALLLTQGAQFSSRGDVSAPAAYGTLAGAKSLSVETPDNYRAALTNLLHWEHFPLRVAFVNSMAVGNQDLDRLAQNGFDQWVKATRGGVSYEIVNAAGKPDITITFDVIAGRPQNGERLGQTGFTYNKTRLQLVRATMHLNVWENMTRRDLARFQNTAAHEFGHALGINGHSPDRDDLMYFSSSSSDGVTERDLNTLRQAYGGFSRAFARVGSNSAAKRLQ